MRLHAIASVFLLASAALVAQSAPHWTYDGKTGPINWGKLDPANTACSKGHAQSPIDIRGAHLNKTLAPVEFHYVSGGVTVENNGHTVQVNLHPGSYIVVGGLRYELLQFHFHQPSEEAVHGKFSDLDVHLVHKSADGKLVVLAVRFDQERDFPNALMATLTQHLPQTDGKSETISDLINPGGFLPADRGYWTYTGSLSEPPCTEGVQWIVYEQEIPISRAQFRAFSRLYKLNSRPLQEPHGRRIEASE